MGLNSEVQLLVVVADVAITFTGLFLADFDTSAFSVEITFS